VDVLARLEAPHLPFLPGSLGRVHARHVLEHLDDLAAVMSEIAASLRRGGRLSVEVPYFASVSAFADPTHRRWFTYTTFEHFTEPPATGWRAHRHTWFSTVRFRIEARRLIFGRAHRLLGVAWLANRFPGIYENLLAYWFPARALQVELVKV
jgi:SAM-dependent methyltransferase